MKKMKFFLHFFTVVLLNTFLLNNIISCKQSKQCLTGYKILVRHTFANLKTNLTEYKLLYKCLCPNNYYGTSCEDHASINCYLHKLNDLKNVSKDQIKERIQTQVDVGLQCWARDRFGNFRNNFNDHQIELRQYLWKYNKDNAFGVREQFGAGYQVVWANTTELFDAQGQFKYLKDNNVTQIDNETKLNLLIGNNTELYQAPFKYQDDFLGYGLINGNITFTLKLIDPLKGTSILKNYTQAQVQIKNLEKYLESWNQLKNNQKNIDEIRKNFTDRDVSNLNQTIRKIIDGEYNLKDDKNIKPFIQSNKQLSEPKINNLPTITLPITLQPKTQSSYESLRIQLGIFEHFQTLVTHEVSYNQLIYNIETKGMGLPQPIGKHLTVTDEGNKSYMKILVVVGIVALVYLGLSYGCKRYKKWKNTQYVEEKDEESSRKRFVKDVIRRERKELKVQEDMSRQFNDEQLRTSTQSQASNQPIHDLNSQNPTLLLQQSSKISNF